MRTCLSVCLWVYVSVRYKKMSIWLFYSGILYLWNKFSHRRCSLPFHVAWLAVRPWDLPISTLYCWVYIHAEPYLLWCGCWGSTLRSSGLYIKHFTHLPRPVNVVVFTNFIILVLFSDNFLLKLNTCGSFQLLSSRPSFDTLLSLLQGIWQWTERVHLSTYHLVTSVSICKVII